MVRGGPGFSIRAIAPAPSVTHSDMSGSNVTVDKEDHWRSFDNSVNAVSFGFVATAILISMFLVMAIFERFLRPRPPEVSGGGRNTVEGEGNMISKLDYPSPKMTVYPKAVSVLMPGEKTPTFLAHPTPAPCTTQ